MADSQVVEVPDRTTNDPVTPVNNNPPPVQHTPVIRKAATQEHSMDAPLSDDAYEILGNETNGHYFVGMMPKDFLDEFLPWNTDTPVNYKQRIPDQAKIHALQSVPPRPGHKESHMYTQFVKALDGWVTGIDNGQKLRFGHFAKPDSSCASMNVDVSTYWEQDYPVVQGSQGLEPGSCTFSHQQTHEEFKSDHTHDAFKHSSDEGPHTEATAEEAEDTSEGAHATFDEAQATSDETATVASEEIRETLKAVEIKEEEQEKGFPSLIAKVEVNTQRGIHTRGQIAAYAGVAMFMAFRNHFFSLLILGKYARIIRWDRRGAIVTSRFDYTKRPELIFEFYLRFSQLSPRQRGFDTNVEPLEDRLPNHVAKAFDNYYLKSWYKGAKYGHKDVHERIPASDMRFFRIQVEDRTLNRTEAFFIPAPAFKYSCLEPFARASRRCLAFVDNPVEAKMCFMKDSWQEVSWRTAPEADIYRKLHENNVPNIASMRLGDDVAGLETETQNKFHVLSHSGRYKQFGSMVCHRIILDTVARDLSTFTWCKVLFSCLADAVDAAQQAYKAGVLHRDISAGNIMIVRNEETQELRGVLIDWDMCLLLDQRHLGATRSGRTGTWAFMAARLLEPADTTPVVHSLSDDMESIFWVLAFEVMRYTKHTSRAPHALYKFMKSLFEDPVEDYGSVTGGDQKFSTLLMCANGKVKKGLSNFEVKGLKRNLVKLAVVFNARYAGRDPLSEDENDSDGGSDDGGMPAPASGTPLYDLDNPDEKWLSNFLRRAAEKMGPRGVMPTGLMPIEMDSQPPVTDLSKWGPATTSRYKEDFYPMMWLKNENDSKQAQEKHFKRVTSSMGIHISGRAYSSGKRPLDDDDVSEKGAQAKRRRPFS